MITMQRNWAVRVAGALWLAASVLAPQSLPAQAIGSSELDLLRTLPPDQQQALLDRVLGGSTGTIGTPPATSTTTTPTQDINPLLRESLMNAGTDNGVPVLNPGDSIIIEIDYDLPDLPINNSQSGPAQQSAANAVVNSPGAAAASPQTSTQTVPPARTVAINPEELPLEERAALDRAIQQVRSKNPYQLSPDGVLYLPGFSGIPLAGLTEEKAALRLRSEPALNKLEMRVTRLPLRGPGVEPLKPFGYELFSPEMRLFAPDASAPVPGNYVVGAGDTLQVTLFGNQDRTMQLVVSRDGTLTIPEIGPIAVGGQTFLDAKEEIERRISREMIGVKANVSVGAVRGIQVFVVGEARVPGSYTVSGLSTISSALYAAGGITTIGSLRNIQLKRRGQIVGRLDLYDLLLNGDTSGDSKLLPGDAIFIPPVGPTVSVDGEVQRPAIYELRGETSVTEMVRLAGGLTSEADSRTAVLTRTDERQERIVIDANLDVGAAAQHLRNGDALRVRRLQPTLHQAVVVEGHVYTAGAFAWRDGLRLSDVIRSLDDLQPNADVHYVLIRREIIADRRISILSSDLAAALQKRGGKDDVALMPRDHIIVFDKEGGRERVIAPLLDELRRQGTFNEPSEVVRIDGQAKAPGEYPLEPGMRISDLIRAGGSLSDAAFGGAAELTRYEVKDGEMRRTELIKIDLASVLRGDPASDLTLRPFDSVSIKGMPDWRDREVVELVGEVRFPGFYEIKRGETLRAVLERAGGLNSYAFPEGSVFTREDLRVREQEQLDVLADRLQNDLSTLALQGAAANQAQAGNALTVGQSLLTQLRSSKAVGRLVIDLERTMALEPNSPEDILLHNGDRLMVPKLRQEVMVLGEVQNATSHLYRPDLSRQDYISLSGGQTRKADDDKIYVVRANGSVISSEGNRWFRSGDMKKMEPGDTVVVPLDTERLPALPFWQAVTQILYNVAVSVAAVGSFNR